MVSWSHNAGCEQVISSRSFDILWQHTLFASEMMKTNYNKRSYNRFAHQKRCISCILVRASHLIWNSARKTILHVSEIHEQWQQNETYNCQFKTTLYVTGSDVTECEMQALARWQTNIMQIT